MALRPVKAVLPAASRLLTTSRMTTGQTDSTPCDEDQFKALLKARVTMVFAAFQVQFPDQFSWNYPASDEAKLKAGKRSWFRNELGALPQGLFDLGLRRMGLACKKIPSLAAFLELCRPTPDDLGMPTVEAAYNEAVRHAKNPQHRWRHPAVHLAAAATGMHDLHCAEGWAIERIRKSFEYHYSVLVRQVGCGEPLAMPMQAIAHDSQRSFAEVQQEHSEQEAQRLVEHYGLSGSGLAARDLLLAKLRISRGEK
ncbi:replication protein P [Pseudomonas sp. AU12215]|uniref:replication protein P n=1 Tax=Pseudomonas sp. AU12215 TaxID=1860123 RepID=UPI00114769EF|nr:replication protein P [Pseudomonas sp. AU12215]